MVGRGGKFGLVALIVYDRIYRMKIVKVFKNGRSRAVRIPKAWLGGADEVLLTRRGDDILIRPSRESLGELSARFRADPVDLKRIPQARTQPRDVKGQ